MSGTLNKLLRQTSEEEIALKDRLNLHQFLLRQFEVKVHIQSSNKLGDRICILICLLFDDANKFAHLFLVRIRVTFAKVRSYNCGGDVSKNPGRWGLNGVDVCRGEEQFAEGFTAVFGVEEGEERPVDQPRSMKQLYRRIREGLMSINLIREGYSVINDFFDFVEFFHCTVPIPRQNFRGKLSPCRSGIHRYVGGLNILTTSFEERYQDPEMIQ